MSNIPEFVRETCDFCGGVEADQTRAYVERLQQELAQLRAAEVDNRFAIRDAVHLFREVFPLLRDHMLCNGVTGINPNHVIERVAEWATVRFPFIDSKDPNP